MPNRIEIGKVCEKGPHTDFAGNSDYGSCGNHYFGTIYLSVEQDREGRGEPLPDLAHIAAELRRIVRDAENHRWCGIS